ncbi:gamma-glutamyltransferase [Synechococcus sp. BSF8S]|uniref:gamma-glutamyltransferase n=1 Tax=Synechococcales TaxID=1890424 RepID=UPI001627F5BF|nr:MULTISPECIES: gamma-glutamyltransferase [unclassified Synechococcus]MBC1261470.1 gamma-glutamyltransferase [Synechococcus sp. BSF8S]MBC1264247.1 gamma-glutamyltransferase [Synechococcus sp. BSA11S]
MALAEGRRLLGLAVVLLPLAAGANVLQEAGQRFQPLWSAGGMVASQEAEASRVGRDVLRAGGNAVDAAVAASFALAVTHPQAGNLGGGGFLVLWQPERLSRGRPLAPRELRVGQGRAVTINFRERAPLAAGPDLLLDASGRVDRRKATRSLLSTGVPGTVAGLLLAHRHYGRLPLARLIAPSIRLADQGVVVSKSLADSLKAAAPRLRADPESARLFFRPGGKPYRPGDRLRQPELAGTLRRIAAEGEQGFYAGPVAQRLVALMRRRGGLISADDLRLYRARLQAPLLGDWRGHPVIAMPPPSSGGVTLIQLLNILEGFDLAALGLNSAATLHPMVEAMNLAYRDRNRWLGDPRFVAMPLKRLLSQGYADQLRRTIRPDGHRPAGELDPPPAGRTVESTDTTHLSVIDRDGTMVATTTTLNFPYGNGVSVPGAGFLLNNEMDDFTALPGEPNAFGLVQGKANAIAPGKQPLSSMAPTLVLSPEGLPLLATGSPGGSRIITTVLQVLLNRLEHGLNLASAVAASRIHSQHWPDQLAVEEGLSPDTLRILEAMGHRWRLVPAMGAAHSLEALPGGGTLGAVDPRRAEAAVSGE